jgi:hypothetical protein
VVIIFFNDRELESEHERLLENAETVLRITKYKLVHIISEELSRKIIIFANFFSSGFVSIVDHGLLKFTFDQKPVLPLKNALQPKKTL